jgi:hypothetical protein
MKDELRKILEELVLKVVLEKQSGIKLHETEYYTDAERLILELFNKQLPKEKEYGIFAELYKGQAEENGIIVRSYNQCLADIRRAAGLEETE